MRAFLHGSNARAVGFLMASNVVFTVLELFGKQLVAGEGIGPMQILWLRGLLSSLVVPLTYLHVVFTTVAAFVVFGTLPDALAMVGVVLIVGGGVYVFHREATRRPPPWIGRSPWLPPATTL